MDEEEDGQEDAWPVGRVGNQMQSKLTERENLALRTKIDTAELMQNGRSNSEAENM